MNAEVINLRQFKRAKAKQQQDRQAEANRASFGRTKAQRILEKAKSLQDQARLEGHRLEPTPTDDPT